MDAAFKHRIQINYVALNNDLDVDSILPYMMANYIISPNSKEEIEVERTRQRRVSKFLGFLLRGGPNTKNTFLNALRNTNQSVLADLLEGISRPPPPPQQETVKPTVFSDLIDSVVSLKPGELQTERHGVTLLTSTKTYIQASPVSKLGAVEIPFLFSVKGLGFSRDSVLGWKFAPSKAEFERSFEQYEKEIAEVKLMIQQLQSGGFHMMMKPTEERMIKLLEKYSDRADFVSWNGGYVHIVIQTLDLKKMAPAAVDMLCCLVHLMCFCDHKFIFRKTCVPKPNCYLLFRAQWLHLSDIVYWKDVDIVKEAIGLDESVHPITVIEECPW